MQILAEDFTERTTSNCEWNWLFHGEFMDETGLYNYGYRSYHPQLGRWISRDPIEENGGLNLYGMVGNNAVMNWDHLGLLRFPYPRNRRLGVGTENIMLSASATASRMDHIIGDGRYGNAKIDVSSICDQKSGKPLIKGFPEDKTEVFARAGLFSSVPIVDIDVKSPFYGEPSFVPPYAIKIHYPESLYVVADFKTSTDQSFANFAFPLASAPGLAPAGSLGIWIGGAISAGGMWVDSRFSASDAERHIFEFRCSCIPTNPERWWISWKHKKNTIYHKKGGWFFGRVEVDFIDHIQIASI